MTGFCWRPRDYIPTADAQDAIVSAILNAYWGFFQSTGNESSDR